MTSPAVHSEDDNFIIGAGDNYDRLRRDARQLHLSKHNETRSKAHFARFRNAALKCSMESTHKRVDQERSLALRELERAQAETRKRKEKYDARKVSYLPDISISKTPNTASKASQNTTEKGLSAREQSFDVSKNGANSWRVAEATPNDDGSKTEIPIKNKATNSESRDGNSWMSGKMPSSVNEIQKVSLDEKKLKTRRKTSSNSTTTGDELSASHASLPSIKSVDSLSTNSDVTLNLSGIRSKEQPQSGFKSNKSNQSGRRLYRAYSSKSVRIYQGDLTVRRSNSYAGCSNLIENEKKKNQQFLRDFDGLLKWFSDYSGTKFKPSFSDVAVEEPRETHAQEQKKALLPKCSMSPLYFKFGVPENGVFRLC